MFVVNQIWHAGWMALTPGSLIDHLITNDPPAVSKCPNTLGLFKAAQCIDSTCR